MTLIFVVECWAVDWGVYSACILAAERPDWRETLFEFYPKAMKILFATGRPFFPDLFGGAERSMHLIMGGLGRRGHECQGVSVIGNERQMRLLSIRRLLSARIQHSIQDDAAGFPMWRTRSWLLEAAVRARLKSFRPDVMFTQLGSAGELALWALEHGVRPYLFLRDTEDIPFDVSVSSNPQVNFVANSEFVARWANTKYGISAPVIYPPLEMMRFRPAANPSYVTFINPIPRKGLELALSVADALPHIPFLFVESWPQDREELDALSQKLEKRKNVTLWRRRIDVQSVYDVTKLLLVPSVWDEAFGRVVIEAQACGIPVIGRAVGGVPEAVRDGGVVMPASADADDWARVVADLWGDESSISRLRHAALRNANEGPWNPSNVVVAAERLLAVPVSSISN